MTEPVSSDLLARIFDRLGHVEHLLNAVLAKQERSTDNIIGQVRLYIERIDDRVRNLHESIEDDRLEDERRWEAVPEERRLRDLRYLREVLEREEAEKSQLSEPDRTRTGA